MPRPYKQLIPPKLCEWCEKPFVKRSRAETARARFCGPSCSNSATAARLPVHLRCRSEERMKSLEQRFWEHVVVPDDDSDACWAWDGSTLPFGYGLINRGRTGMGNARAHRLSWELHFGPIADGLHVLHRCDNPPCTRPDHLFLGTNLRNIEDRVTKGRPGTQSEDVLHGADHALAKLTDEAVREARRLRDCGMTYRALADRFGVSSTTIHQAVSGKTWAHVA